MGRHGGGSRSGGSGGSHRSSGGSRGGGSGVRTSSKPFAGCYNRSYINRRGVRVHYYTSDASVGTKGRWNAGIIIILLFITCHMLLMVGCFLGTSIHIGKKVDGDPKRIQIVDTVDILTPEEESQLLDLYHEVYDKSGMPITLYTDNFGYKDHYRGNEELTAIQVYSEDLYYSMGMEEDAMVILFTVDNSDDFYDWEYDVYCGDDTEKCFSDDCFDYFLNMFQKSLASKDLCDAMIYSWHEVMPQLAETSVDKMGFVMIPFLLLFYSIFYIAILAGTQKNQEAYKYFKEHPEELEMRPMTLYSECPSCGASNSAQTETCMYCGTLLKVSDGNTMFVKPGNEKGI